MTWNATPIVPRPPCVPMTGPISPTTMSSGAYGRSMSTNDVDVAAVGVEHGQVLDRSVVALDLLDEEGERLRPGPLLATLFDDATGHLDDRLDRQGGGEQGLGVADAATLLQVLQRVEGAEDARPPDEFDGVRLDVVDRRAIGRQARARQGDRADTHGDAAAVEHAHIEFDGRIRLDRPGGELGALHRRRQCAGQRHDDDAGGTLRGQPSIGLLELARGGGRRSRGAWPS